MADHDELRRLALAATPGPWATYDPKDSCCGHGCTIDGCREDHPSGQVCLTGPAFWDCGENRYEKEADAVYIAAANPARVLALLDEVGRLRAENEKLLQDLEVEGGVVALQRTHAAELERQRDSLRAALSEIAGMKPDDCETSGWDMVDAMTDVARAALEPPT